MRTLSVFFFVLVFFSARSQNIISSNTYIQTCIDKTQCSSINSSSYLFYDETPSNLYLKVDFAGFKVGNDSIDDWLNDLTATFLYFKAHLPSDFFKNLENNNRKTLTVKGQVYLNGIWQTQTIDISVFSSENSLMTTANNGSPLDNYKVNFSLSIAPKDFKIDKKPRHLRNTIFIGLALGRINQLPPGKQELVGEAYDRQ